MVTISEVAGSFGIEQDTDSDPFADVEEATLASTQKVLTELRSQKQEVRQAQGFGRSTFHEAIEAKQEADIAGQTLTDLQRARSGEVLKERAFDRSIIGQGVAADIASTAADEGLERTQALDVSRAGLSETAAEANLRRETEFAESGADITSRLAEEQFGFQGELTEQQAGIATEAREQAADLQGDLLTQGAEISKEAAEQQFGFQGELLGQQEQIATTAREQVAALGETATAADFARQSEALTTQFERGEISAETAFQSQTALVEQQAQNAHDQLQQQFDLQKENLPFELQEKLQYEKDLADKNIELEKEKQTSVFINQAIGLAISKAIGSATNLFEF